MIFYDEPALFRFWKLNSQEPAKWPLKGMRHSLEVKPCSGQRAKPFSSIIQILQQSARCQKWS